MADERHGPLGVRIALEDPFHSHLSLIQRRLEEGELRLHLLSWKETHDERLLPHRFVLEALKRRAVAGAALGVGVAVALAGGVGLIGLVAPHLFRLLAGPDHRYLLTGSALLGASLAVLADLLARDAGSLGGLISP